MLMYVAIDHVLEELSPLAVRAAPFRCSDSSADTKPQSSILLGLWRKRALEQTGPVEFAVGVELVVQPATFIS